jgi:Fur family transcriptional regulator, ferric uptake regulator
MAQEFSLGTVEVALSPIERFEEFLQSRGKRITVQRRIIVQQVARRHEHFDADQLLADLAKVADHRKVSRPTVYRTLAEMTEAGLLRKMDLSGRAVYEHDYGYPQHDHLYCQQCHKLIEFSSDDLLKLVDAVSREHQFRVLGHRFIITGQCSDCRRARQANRRLELV